MEDKIFNIIKGSKKYNTICDDTIHRICVEEIPKYNKEKDIVKSVKNKLHQISGSFFSDCLSREVKRLEKSGEADYINLLKLHSSTNERLSFCTEFYDDIFGVVGSIDSVLDIACGLNPVMVGEYLRAKEIRINKYIAEDIHLDALEVVKYYFDTAKYPIEIRSSDLLITIPDVTVDIVLLLKVLPLLEQQRKDYYKHVINELNAKYIVVTFPTKTMSGKVVGMLDNYKNLFDEFISSCAFKVIFTKAYNNELLYVLMR